MYIYIYIYIYMYIYIYVYIYIYIYIFIDFIKVLLYVIDKFTLLVFTYLGSLNITYPIQ